MIEQLDDNFSYIFGFLITDGNLQLSTRNRGKVTIELHIKDEDIIDKLLLAIPNSFKRYRTRNTNFKSDYRSVIFSNYHREFRQMLIDAGFPISNKTNLASSPKVPFNEISFWRGVIDGDGSIGFTSQNEPFISLVTKSEFLKDSYLDFLKKTFNIEKHLKRNTRDCVYNIVVKNEVAVELAKLLYLDQDNILCLNRKLQQAQLLQTWQRIKKKRTISQ